MNVASKTAHEKTDKLFIYTFESPEQGELQIVANLTNVYEVGETAAIALLGTVLPEGEMKPRKVFGIPSSGMALGKVDVALDTDLTAEFGADAPVKRHTVTIEIEARTLRGDVEKAARKAVGKGQGSVVHRPTEADLPRSGHLRDGAASSRRRPVCRSIMDVRSQPSASSQTRTSRRADVSPGMRWAETSAEGCPWGGMGAVHPAVARRCLA